MKANKFASSYKDVNDLMTALDEANIPSDQDWDNGTTTWKFDDGSFVKVEGTEIMVGDNQRRVDY